MPAATSASRRAAGLAASLLFGLSLFAASWGLHYRLDDYPPWLDYDTAATGIYINSVSYRESYDAFFRDSSKPHNVFRASWAAAFLPATAPLSLVQRTFGVPPDRVGDLLKAAAVFLAVLGTGCAARLAMCSGMSAMDAAFLFGVVAALPPFLLYVRTGNLFFSYFMFWLAVACIDRYVSGDGRRWVYALAAVVALYAMVPYVPITVLPVAGFLLAWWRGALGRVLGDVHLYAAAMASVALFVLMRVLVATSFEPSYEAWSAKTATYLADRSGHAISPGFLDPALLPDKLTKLVHQHLWFARDQLGDRTRSDAAWTVPAPQLPWVALLAVALFGMWRCRRNRNAGAAPFAAVLLGTYGLALTLSFPEGRYMVPALPALAFFAVEGLRGLVPSPLPRTLVCSGFLAAMAWSGFSLVSGPYQEWMVRQWQDRAGMKEAFALVRERLDPDYGLGRPMKVWWPGMNHEVWLYMRMIANRRDRLYELATELDREAAGERLFAAAHSDDAARLAELETLGFRSIGTVTDPIIARRLEVLVREP